MSYGRDPYYIFADNKNMNFVLEGRIVQIPEDAIAQMVAHMAWQGEDELNEWIARGAEQDSELKTRPLKVRLESEHGPV